MIAPATVVKTTRATQPLKIGYLMQDSMPDFGSPNGPRQHIVAVVDRLRARGHSVRLIGVRERQVVWSDDGQEWQSIKPGVTASKPFRWIESPLRRAQTALKLPYVNFFDSLKFADVCVHLLRGYDLLYSRIALNGLGDAMASRWTGWPLIVEVNGIIFDELPDMGIELSPLQKSIIQAGMQQVYNTAAAAVFVGPEILDGVRRDWTVDPRKARVIRNGADVELFATEYDEREVKTQYGLGPGPIIAFAGAFHRWYALDTLVRSFKLVKDCFPQAQLILVGDGQLRASITDETERLGLLDSVMLTGVVDHAEVARLLSVVDIAVIPHRALNRGPLVSLKLFEYMAAGKAVIISGAEPAPVSTDAPIVAVITKATDAQSLAHELIELCCDPTKRAQMGQQAQQAARQLYSWDCTVDQIEELCYATLSRRR